jgi:ATP-dependent Lon protease
MRPEFFTNQSGLITDYLAEFMREMRKRNFSDAVDRWFKLGRDLDQRDTIAVRRTASGLLELLYPPATTTRRRSAAAWSTRWRPAVGSRGS